MLPYTKVVAGASTNVTTPTNEQFDQGNDQLTPFNSAKNNGYSRQISQGVFNLSAELEAVIVAAGLTPDASLDQLLEAINILKVPPAATETVAGIAEITTSAEIIAGAASKIVDPAKLLGLFAASIVGETGSLNIPINDSGAFSNIIVKFGKLTNVALNQTFHPVVFAAAFPNNIFNISATLSYEPAVSGSINPVIKKSSIAASGFQVAGDNSNDSTTGDIYWIAIGN